MEKLCTLWSMPTKNFQEIEREIFQLQAGDHTVQVDSSSQAEFTSKAEPNTKIEYR